MDQLPIEFKMTMLIGDYSDLLDLLETDREKWQWLIDDINKQISQQLNENKLLITKKNYKNMLITTKGMGVELLKISLPYPEQMKNIDLEKEDAIYFDWRFSRYKLDLRFCQIDRVNNGVLEGDDCSILMRQLLKNNLGEVLKFHCSH